MKRIIAVLALIALLVSFTGVPVSAAAINPPAFAGRGDSDPAAGGADGRARRGETYGGGHFG